MFKKILVANRGEIACRIIRTARRLGIKTVAIYSDVDHGARHVEMADEAVRVGPAPSAESYLNIAAVLKAVRQMGADAVHPGYGFLAENAKFAERLQRRKVTLIGPRAKAIRIMGDKLKSKELAESVGVAIVPGHAKAVSTLWQARRVCAEIGYPVMLKAAAGGGGKGMRIIHSEVELREGIRGASSEAKSSFGDGRVFIEKFILDPRHIEIQILADQYGNVIHLGERECSIQRRHQKVIEEAPSPFVDGPMRRAMGEQAIILAKAVDYVSAGTVEFIVDANKNFYFLEMNTRLQVEHPVTERITGLDLVEQMIHIAAGGELKLKQKDVHFFGWALEARVYAESPSRGFLPSTGRLVRYLEPRDSGPDKPLRVDTGVGEGDEITVHYDPMIAKVITSGDTREAAIGEMRRALDQFYIEGISHNIDFLAALVSHPRFGEGRLSTNFIHEEFGSRFDASDGEHDNPKLFAAVAATIHHLIANRDAQLVSRDLDGETIDRFRFAVSNDWVAVVGNDHFPVAMTTRDGGVDVTIESESFRVRTQWNPSDPIFHGRVNGYGVSMMVKRTGAGYRLTHGGCQYEVKVMSPRAAELLGRMPPKRVERTDKFLLAPMPGLLMNIRVEVGQDIRAGDPVAVIEAMKMENQLLAESDGVVAKIHAQVGESVKLDDPIVEFE